ncbi:helix-turn-helix domain-containing protein [Glycomyces halotolerans]
MAHDRSDGIRGLNDRESDSPYVERVYQVSESAAGGAPAPKRMVSVANSNWELVVWTSGGATNVSVRGPETRPSEVPLDGTPGSAFGIVFRHGAFLKSLPVGGLVDSSVESPHTTARTFVLHGDQWEIPAYENVETFVDRMVRSGLLSRDPLVTDVIAGDVPPLITSRSVQRRVAAATGLTQGMIRQIERARQAAILLRRGEAAIDVVHEVGYHDQPHLARSLARFIGRRATDLRRPVENEVLSLLYKTDAQVRQ